MSELAGCRLCGIREQWHGTRMHQFEPVSTPEPLSPSPEIRYQLRNWHHVTCAGFGGQACTCLAQREALIAELAYKEKQ